MSKKRLDAVGSLTVGCTVRVATDDRPEGIDGTVTGIRRCDGLAPERSPPSERRTTLEAH